MLLSDIGQEGIVVGDYNLGMVCYSDESRVHLRNAGDRVWCGLENVIIMPALSRRIDGWKECHGVEGVSWCGGSVMVCRECHGVEGVSWCGGSVGVEGVSVWRECHGVEGVLWCGGSVMVWWECHGVVGVLWCGGSVMVWRECCGVE